MKIVTVICAIFVLSHGLSDEEQWITYKQKYNKLYTTNMEETYRYHIFQTNLQKIREHNVKYNNGQSSYFLGINKFADLTPEEFSKQLLRQKNSKLEITISSIFPRNLDIPDVIDWRSEGAVLQVKDQGNCGSCWAFSATGALEGQNFLVHNISIPLSEQELMDCSTVYGNMGCSGGDFKTAFDYVHDHGIHSEESYPLYTEDSIFGQCKLLPDQPLLKIKEYKRVAHEETDVKIAVATIGPISVAIFADPLQLYKGGIYDDEVACPNNQGLLNHAPLIVGYGNESNIDYWLLKNSWGTGWGENGFFKLRRNNSICGVLLDPAYPIIS